ncbi:acetyl-CoA carboxylase biotin carboxylase subunit family protein [Aerococcaceae bacterium WGS1372]
MNEKINFIMISPHFPTNFETFAVRLKEKGINVLGIADEPYDNLSMTLRNNLTEYYRVDNMDDYDQMYRAVAYFAFKYGKIDRIESHNEHWLELDAQLRTDFNVFGYKNLDIRLVKFKSTMKEVFREIGIPVAKGRVIKSEPDAIKLAKELKYPVIIKPDTGVGANDTYKIKSRQELKDILPALRPDVPYIMEEYIEGDIVTFDGLTNRDGEIVFASTLNNDKPIIDILEDNTDMFYHIPREIPKDLYDYGVKCVEAFGIKERFFHFEFFRTKDGSLYALEVNCRPPGGYTIDMFNYANDFDIFSEYANLVKDNEFKAEITRPYHALYISRRSHVDYAYTNEEIKDKYRDELIMVVHVPGVFSQLMGESGMIFRLKEEDKLNEIIENVSKRRVG